MTRVTRYPLIGCIALILASALQNSLQAADAPKDLVRRVIEKETAAHEARLHYTYQQTVLFSEVRGRNSKPSLYREVREVIFSPEGERTERIKGSTSNTLQRLRMTEQDFHDIREIQPLLLTKESAGAYRIEFKGEDLIDTHQCWVLRLSPRQLLDGQRMFEGLVWVNQADFSILQMEGAPVPQIRSTSAERENLFPRFTTIREKIGEHWFPVRTFALDTLPFSSGPIDVSLEIRYEKYQRFGAESKVLDEP